jgi:hypothetical protein
MKFVEPSHFTDPDAAARKLLQIANAVEAIQDGRIFISRLPRSGRHPGPLPRRSRARLHWAGCRGTKAGPTLNSRLPVPRCLPERCMMTETPEEFRQRVERIDSKFFEDLEKRAGPYRAMSFEFEKLAVEYSNKGFQNLTYLNGGALVAIPTAMAFFKAEVAKSHLLITAGFFVAGLLFVVLAQAAAFFTMAKRAEA